MGHRLEGIPGFGIDRVAAAAGANPDVLRLENLDTDVPPHPGAVEVTRAAVGRDEANSYLPFSGLNEMKEAVAGLIRRRGGPEYDPYGEIVITQGEGDNMLNALLALTDPGDEVILTDPTYAGMLQRVRLVGAVPRLVPLRGVTESVVARAARPNRRRIALDRVRVTGSVRFGRIETVRVVSSVRLPPTVARALIRTWRVCAAGLRTPTTN